MSDDRVDLVDEGAESEDVLATLPGHHEPQESSGGGIPKVLLWIGGLLLFNGLSYAFDWGWILY